MSESLFSREAVPACDVCHRQAIDGPCYSCKAGKLCVNCRETMECPCFASMSAQERLGRAWDLRRIVAQNRAAARFCVFQEILEEAILCSDAHEEEVCVSFPEGVAGQREGEAFVESFCAHTGIDRTCFVVDGCRAEIHYSRTPDGEVDRSPFNLFKGGSPKSGRD